MSPGSERLCSADLNKHCSLLESSILSFQGRRLIIDRRKVKRYGYGWAEGHQGAGGDSWGLLLAIQAPDKQFHSQAHGHLKKSHSCGESKAGPGTDVCGPGQVLRLSFNYLHGRQPPPPPTQTPTALNPLQPQPLTLPPTGKSIFLKQSPHYISSRLLLLLHEISGRL